MVGIQELGPRVSSQEVDAGNLAPLVKVNHGSAELAEVLVDEVQPVGAL